MSAMTYAGVHIFGPEKLGGKGNIRLKAEEEAQRTGRPYADIVLEVRVPFWVLHNAELNMCPCR